MGGLWFQKDLNSSDIALNIPIVSPNSWISNGFGIILEKFSWQRQFVIPISFKTLGEKIFLKISGDIRFPNRKTPCCEKFEFPIIVDISKND